MPTLKYKSRTRKRILASILVNSINLVLVWSLAPRVQSKDPPTKTQDQPTKNECSDPSLKPLPEQPDDYWRAVGDAAKPLSPSKVFRNLTAITRDNTGLSWDDKGRVLVIVWTSHKYDPGDQVLDRDLWVTVDLDLQNFCKNGSLHPIVGNKDCHSSSLECRINQLLGLPFDSPNEHRQIVQIWVEPQYLFRPSPNPEITDHAAELEFRPLNEHAVVPFGYFQWFYSQWFYLQYADRYQYHGKPITSQNISHFCKMAYPWTRLGYTYDWGNPADWKDSKHPQHVGLSEFIIRQGSPISVNSDPQLAKDYCRKTDETTTSSK